VPARPHEIETFGQVVGGVVHDVNNLLGVALGCASKLRSELPEDSPAVERLDAITDAVVKAGDLNRRLLRGRTAPPETQTADLTVALPALVDLLGCIVPPGIDVSVEVEAHLPNARIQPYELDRVVTNLVRNALDVVGDGDRIEVRASLTTLPRTNSLGLEPGEYVVLGVFDSGPGIAPEHIERLFAPFFTTKPEGEGLGLGLSSVDWIVRRRGGAVQVTSRPRTGGTLFEAFLPAARRR
jgi:signal transduction histidine kinase